MSDTVLTRGFTQSVDLPACRERVFEFLDDFANLGSHMTRSSWMMAGSSMHYEFDVARGRETGARVRISGSFLGLRLQIDEMVDDREPPSRKSWRTVDAQRMWVIAAYRMGFSVDATRSGDRAKLQDLTTQFTQIAGDTRPFAQKYQLSDCLPDNSTTS